MRSVIRRSGRSFRRAQMEFVEARLLMAVFNVNSTADILNPPAGTVTLRSAIQAANATVGDNTINLTVAGDYKISLSGPDEDANQSGDFDIIPNASSPANSTLLIDNTSGGKVTVDGNHLDRVFDINPGDTNDPATKMLVTMQGFTVENGRASSPMTPDSPSSTGGGIRDQGNADLTLSDMTVTNNVATADGGGVSMENTADASWKLTLDNTIVSDNRAGDAGGGVESDGSGNVIIENGSAITGNSSVNQGGGVWLDAITLDSANLSLTNTLISDNTAENGPGGGVGNAGNGTVTFVGCTVKSNNSGGTIGDGGGFGDQNSFGTLVIRSSLFRNNFASGDGGAIQTGSPITQITSSEIDSNSASGSGGGIFDNGLQLTIQSSTLANNSAGIGGGGIELQTFGSAGAASSITDSTISGNSAPSNTGADGGGIDAPAEFTGVIFYYSDTISGNFALNGGGIFWNGASSSGMIAQNTVIAGNSAASGPDADNSAGNFIDDGGNFIGASGAGSGNTGFTAGTTQTGTVSNPLDPQLGLLQYNGGPTVGASADSLPLQTQLPLPGSPLIDQGVNNSGSGNNDERGFNRVINDTIDIGAVEVQPPQANETLGSSLNPSQQGQDVTFTATLAGAAPGSNTPTGTVKFLDGSHTLGTEPLVNGVASFETSTLSVGPHTITAIYSGDVNFISATTQLVQNVNAPPSPSNKVSIIPDPCDSGKTAVEIFGTNGNDTITVTKSGSSQGKVVVKINGSNKGTFSFTGSIIVHALSGNDNVSIDGAITRQAFIFGEAGNDTLNGGGGNDVIVGGDANDQINGNNGRDILLGSNGSDKLNGGNDDDILDAGTTNYDTDIMSLCKLQDEWTRTDKNYTYRVQHITQGGGLNGSVKLNASTSFSSTTLKDTLTGGSGSDLFFAAMTGDKLTDKSSGETAVNIG